MNFETHDKLNRKILAEKLNIIISNSEELREDNSSFVIALDSSWGTGKTTFIDMWSNMIQTNTELKVISYNAWENDDFDKPIISILSEILDDLDNRIITVDKKNEIKSKAIEITKYIAKKGVPMVLKNKFGFDVSEFTNLLCEKSDGTITTQDVGDIVNLMKQKENQPLFEEYKDYKQTKENFSQLLNEIGEKTKVIFIIDELDRCNPLYAIELLETLKHFFNINNIVFLLAVDILQLSHSIATIYGQNMDSEGYLTRFFDIKIKIPEPKNIEYIRFLVSENDILIKEKSIEELVSITNKLKLSLRDLNRIFKNVAIMFKLSKIETYSQDYLLIYTYLIILKYKFPNTLNTILRNRFLERNNSSYGSYIELEDEFFKPSPTINKFMKNFSNGKMQTNISDLLQDPNTETEMLIHSRELENIDNELLFYQFVERKLELYY